MKTLTDYIARQDNLLPVSATATTTLLFLIFILSHVIRYAFPYVPLESQEKMEIRELIALKFTSEAQEPSKKAFKLVRKSAARSAPAPAKEIKETESKPVQESPKFAALMQGFDARKLISAQSRSQRRPAQRNTSQTSAMKIEVAGHEQDHQVQDLNSLYTSIRPSEVRGRKSAAAGDQSLSVQVGGNSRTRVTSDLQGTNLSAPISSRTSRSGGIGRGGPVISLPSGSSGAEAEIDLVALIEWMKKHPGTIPGLVRYEMGHRSGDLASAQNFTIGGRRYLLFLSCNEVEMLLRICLIERNSFTLLKDNGIKEESNYLTIGKVSWVNRQIHSLISTRKAPRGQAPAFYKIFWTWWLNEQSK